MTAASYTPHPWQYRPEDMMSPVTCLYVISLVQIFFIAGARSNFEKSVTDLLKKCALKLSYGGVEIGSGCDEFVEIADAKLAPSVQYEEASTSSEARYTLMMIDPDAPSPIDPTMKYWRHWLLTNIKGSDLKEGGAVSGDEITEYIGPSPPSGDPHRYQFLLVEQPQDLDTSSMNEGLSDDSRGAFDVEKYLEKYNLCKCIVAASQFLAEV